MTESLSYRNQPTDLLCKSMALFLYDRDLRHERVKIKKYSTFKATDNYKCYTINDDISKGFSDIRITFQEQAKAWKNPGMQVLFTYSATINKLLFKNRADIETKVHEFTKGYRNHKCRLLNPILILRLLIHWNNKINFILWLTRQMKGFVAFSSKQKLN